MEGEWGRDLRKRHLLMGFASAPVDFPVSDCINGPSKLLPVTSSTSFYYWVRLVRRAATRATLPLKRERDEKEEKGRGKEDWGSKKRCDSWLSLNWKRKVH